MKLYYKLAFTSLLLFFLIASLSTIFEQRAEDMLEIARGELINYVNERNGEVFELIQEQERERASLRYQVRELWFRGMDEKIIVNITTGKIGNCTFTSFPEVTNTFYDKIPFEPAGYLTYRTTEGDYVIFDRGGYPRCFTKQHRSVWCEELCQEE